MKRKFTLLGMLISIITLMCLSGCGNVMNNQKDDEEEVINHTFYLSDDKFAYKYFSGTTHFSFTDKNDGTKYEDCIYQIQFTPANTQETSGAWIMYIRPVSMPKSIESQYKGTYEGNVKQEGDVKLYVDNKLLKTIKIEYKEIQLTNTKPTTYVFTTNIAKAHKAIGAKDFK